MSNIFTVSVLTKLAKILWPILKPEVEKIWREQYEKAKRAEAEHAKTESDKSRITVL